MTRPVSSSRPRGANATARRVVPYLLAPLLLVAVAVADSPWLRAFPSSVLAVPLFLTTAISVLLPVIVVGIGVRRLSLTALIDVVVYVFVTLLVTLREPVGFTDLYSGLVHGPSQVLTFALPLVSPRTLLVVPVTLCWLCGAVAGECLARGWQTVLPYVALLATFALAYAGSARAISSSGDGRRYDILFAGLLLLALLLMRAVGAWLQQDADAEATQPDGLLPLRSFGYGVGLAIALTAVATLIAQTGVFHGPPTQPARTPPLNRTRPLSPLAFTAGLRPTRPGAAGRALFSMNVDRPSSNYVAIGDVDLYDGDSWSFDRTFRPSGGVIPAYPDPTLSPPGDPVDQTYTIDRGAMTSAPWMPFQYRPQRVTGVAVDVDSASGMIVPSVGLHAGQRYTVQSATPTVTFGRLPRTAQPATSVPPVDTQLPGAVRTSMTGVVKSLQNETGVPASTSSLQFLTALQQDLRTNYSLLSGAAPASISSAAPATSGAPSSGAATNIGGARSGGTSYADVLASILGSDRTATPAQYATLVALVARQLGVPARVVTGFRVPLVGGATTLPARTYSVTTADAWTWVEIPVQNEGWVVLDAAPSTYKIQQPSNQTTAQQPSSQPPTSNGAPLATASSGVNPPAPPSRIAHAHPLSTLTVLLFVLIVVAVLVALLLLAPLLLRRMRAYRRRRVPVPRRRVIGAWQESLDVLSEYGLTDLAALTGAEVAALTARRFGGEPAAQVRYLGDAANRAIFSPDAYVAATDADDAWRAHAVLRRSLRERADLRQRLNADLRFHRERRRRPVTGPTSWAAAARARADTRARRRRPPGRHSARRH